MVKTFNLETKSTLGGFSAIFLFISRHKKWKPVLCSSWRRPTLTQRLKLESSLWRWDFFYCFFYFYFLLTMFEKTFIQKKVLVTYPFVFGSYGYFAYCWVVLRDFNADGGSVSIEIPEVYSLYRYHVQRVYKGGMCLSFCPQSEPTINAEWY